MKPKRCCQSNKDEKKRQTSGSNQEYSSIGEAGESNSAHHSVHSPKKRRTTIALSPIYEEPPKAALSAPKREFSTPPVISRATCSPPCLDQKILRKETKNDQHPETLNLTLSLPSEFINNNQIRVSASEFKLKPRQNWNQSSVSRQLRGTGQTLSSLLNENDSTLLSPPTIMTNKFIDCFDATDCIRASLREIVKPIPRYGSATIGSNATTLNHENKTYTNNMTGEACCTWFNPSWTSAFDEVHPQKQSSSRTN